MEKTINPETKNPSEKTQPGAWLLRLVCVREGNAFGVAGAFVAPRAWKKALMNGKELERCFPGEKEEGAGVLALRRVLEKDKGAESGFEWMQTAKLNREAQKRLEKEFARLGIKGKKMPSEMDFAGGLGKMAQLAQAAGVWRENQERRKEEMRAKKTPAPKP